MFYSSALWQRRTFFHVVANNAEKCSTLLPTMPIIFPCCRQQRGKVILFQFMYVFPRCCRQRRLFFRVVDHSMGKLSGLLPTTWKNDQRCWQQRRKTFEFDYLHEFETISEFTLGCQSGAQADVFHEEKLRCKISWDCPFKPGSSQFSLDNMFKPPF